MPSLATGHTDPHCSLRRATQLAVPTCDGRGRAARQALLVDHDEAVNTGNWAYNSGVGLDPRDRTFRTVSQGEKYDPEVGMRGGMHRICESAVGPCAAGSMG